MNGTSEFRSSLDKLKGRADQIRRQTRQARVSLREEKRKLAASEEALVVVQKVAQETQVQIEHHLSDIVTTSMEAIFPDPYSLAVEFQTVRGRVETHMFFERGGSRFLPLDASGGGAVDVAAMALRFSCYAMKHPRTRPVMILDEPLKWLKGSDLPDRGAQMIREISKKMGVQIIMNSHDPNLIEAADRVIEVKRISGVSEVEWRDV